MLQTQVLAPAKKPVLVLSSNSKVPVLAVKPVQVRLNNMKIDLNAKSFQVRAMKLVLVLTKTGIRAMRDRTGVVL